MNLSDPLALGTRLVAGTALGLLYFGGLWLTLKRIPESRSPALLVLGSMVLRSVLVVAAVYYLSDRKLDLILIMIVGFTLGRLILGRRLGQAGRDSAGEVAGAVERDA